MRFLVLFGIWLAAVPVLAQDQAARTETFFETKIRPVLAGRCFKCHGAQKATNGLRVDSREALLKGGQHGEAVVPGHPERSLLVEAIRYKGERKMPPDKQLPADVVADMERWIAQGATWPATSAKGTAADAGEHWAFQPIRHVSIPVNSTEGTGPSDRATGPVDSLLLAELKRHGLQPGEPADKRTLIRRATFDLIGLPPTPAEVEAFLGDDSPAAFARVVDRLLASPHYGERWGRHWLDLVRYSDEFEDAWRYRDWVVNALNTDLPYDAFIRHQVAGDLLSAPEAGSVNADGIIATTMLSIGPWTGIDRKKRLTDIADDQIDIVSRTFLGLTIACARCHDHKFDPISTADYYGLAGIFFSSHVISDEGYLSHGTVRLRIPLVGEADVERHRQQQVRIQEMERRIQAAVDQQYAEFARTLVPQTARYPLAAWDYEHRPADQAKLTKEEFAARENLHVFGLSEWISYLKGPPLGAFQPLNVAERDF
ncbi:MAG TPA: DUF1549 domain-containing protein, partial [Planctomycetaceae bacterium]|nr:DUF1549 domain-containing protein [Planctomycetaceae bacterium]